MGLFDKIDDARAVIAAIVLLSVFIEMPILLFLAFRFLDPITALDFIRWTYLLLNAQMGYVVGYYFGARNGEKREEVKRSVSIG